MRQRYDPPHDHEWRVPDDNDAALYEDDSVYVYERCEYAEEKHVGYSERLMEDFYETVYECGKERYHRFDVAEVELDLTPTADKPLWQTLATNDEHLDALAAIEDSRTLRVGLADDLSEAAGEKLMDQGDIAEFIGSWGMGVEPGPHQITVGVDGSRYRLTYEKGAEGEA